MAMRGKLTPDRIIETAMQMLDADGVDTFTMRKLAGALDVDPMAIYHYHKNKAALLNAVIQAMLGTCNVPEPSDEWTQDIRRLCAGIRDLANRHPGTFRIYETYDEWVPAEHRIHNAFHATLLRAGFCHTKAAQGVRVLLAYTESFAVDEVTGWLDAEDRSELEASLSQGNFPALKLLIDQFVTSNPDADFEFGLNVLIRGLEGELP